MPISTDTIHPEERQSYAEVGTQTTEEEGDQEQDPQPQQVCSNKLPLIYAEVVPTKGDASAAVQRLLARVRDDHGSLPGYLGTFRLHSDKGQEFLADSLEKYCESHGIRRTTTAGYDPSGNGTGENSIG